MAVLSWQKGEIVEKTERLSSEGAGNKARCRISAPALGKIASLPRVRKDKVVAVRQQLAEGAYDLEERLDALLESLLEDLKA